MFLTKVSQLAGKQKAREEADLATKEVRSQVASLQTQIREKQKTLDQQEKEFALSDAGVQAMLDQFDPDKGSRELLFIQSKIMIAPEDEYQKIIAGIAELCDIASKARRMGVAGKAEGFTKTAKAFRTAWQMLTEEQRDERGLEPIVSKNTSKPLHRALRAYIGEASAKNFLDALPADWRNFVIPPQPSPTPSAPQEEAPEGAPATT